MIAKISNGCIFRRRCVVILNTFFRIIELRKKFTKSMNISFRYTNELQIFPPKSRYIFIPNVYAVDKLLSPYWIIIY